jgi:hypothetical protein
MHLQTGKPGDPRRGFANYLSLSFYSSQGRQTSFPDRNEYLIPHLLETVPNIGSFEVPTSEPPPLAC